MKFSLIYSTIFTLGIALGHAGTLTKSDLTEPVDPAPITADNSEALAKIAQKLLHKYYHAVDTRHNPPTILPQHRTCSHAP